MSLPVHVDAYSGHKANERPLSFYLDEETYDIASIEDRWLDPDAEYFKVRTTDAKVFLLRYAEREDAWTLQSGFDGDDLLTRPGIELFTVGETAIREATRHIAGCERCHADEAELPFDWILAEVLGKRGGGEFVMAVTARCPNCRREISEKTLIEPV
jgi:hypothetical protein